MVQPLKPAWSLSKRAKQLRVSPDLQKLVDGVLEVTDENDQLREFAQRSIEGLPSLKASVNGLIEASSDMRVMLDEYHDLLRDVKAFLRADEVPEAMARISQQEREWWPDEAREV
jgi:uncharacterized coiled-coil DUF342 family protein